MLTRFIEGTKVVFSAAVTWLVFASAVVTIASEEIAAVVGEGTAEDVTAWSLRILAVLGAAIGIIRRVTPVLPEDRGILPGDT
jgi:hypothetical protein